MKLYNHHIELVIDPSPNASKSRQQPDLKRQLAAAGIEVLHTINKGVRLPRSKKAIQSKGIAFTPEKIYVKTNIKDVEMHPWDVAHLSSKAIGAQNAFIEPDLMQEFPIDTNLNAAYKRNVSKGITGSADNGYDPDWQPHKNIIWHLGDEFSQLKTAREAVVNAGDPYIVRIGHLDTGFDMTHNIVPQAVRENKLQRNFVDDENELDAHDPRIKGGLNNPGHGTGTLGILAGTKLRIDTDDAVFNDFLGGAYFAEVVCCRISPTVVLFKASAFAEAINYLVQLTLNGTPVHVVSMSMGGAPARSWAKAVNAAYEAGITVVTATGNNFNGLPTTHVIYPARFGRVIAACGVTNNLQPYHSTKPGEMQGCYGPEIHMKRALAAFTPNTPWARGSASAISFSGAGTSSATPQVAAAAAIYYQKNHAALDALPGWQRVEAIRYALFKSASKQATPDPRGSFRNSFGNGILKAADSLDINVNTGLPKADEDKMPWFPILTTIFKAAPRPGAEAGNKITMFNTELAQLVFYYPELAKLIGNEEKALNKVTQKQWKQFKDAVIQHPGASVTLKKHLMGATS